MAALLVGGGMPSAYAACAITENGVTVASVTNAAAINCIAVFNNSNVTGNITNTSTGVITATGAAAPSRTAISINNSTVGGAIVNAGTLTAATTVILIKNNAVVSGGITNTGTITGGTRPGITFDTVSTFGGGISNSGTISTGFYPILLEGVSTFSGGITNTGKMIGVSGSGIFMNVDTFLGGIKNSGTIASVSNTGINFNSVSVFLNGITNSGTISGGEALEIAITTFAGGIVNTGSLLGRATGIGIFGGDTFSGGISNSGTISGGTSIGILVRNVATFTGGGISNTGTIAGGSVGILIQFSGPIGIFDSGTIIGSGGTAVDLSANSAGNTFTLGPGYSITGNVLGHTGGGDTFQLGGSGAGSFDLSKIGAGQQYQNFTLFNVVSGTWTVSNVFGQAQGWTVTGGTLAGTGTLHTITVDAGATFSPGIVGGFGTMTMASGSLFLGPGSFMAIQIAPGAGNNNSVTMTGVPAALLSNGTGFVTPAPGRYAAADYHVVITPAPIDVVGNLQGPVINGTFTGTMTFSDLTTPGDEDLLVTGFSLVGPPAGTNLNTNQQNVLNGINNGILNSPANTPLVPGFTNLPNLSGAAFANALSQLSGEVAAGADKSTFQLMNDFFELMLDMSLEGRAGPGGATQFAAEQQVLPPDIAQAYNSVLKAPPSRPAGFDARWRAWGAGFGGYNHTSGDPVSGTNTVTARAYGFAAGMDYHYSPDTVLGLSLAGGGTNWNLAQSFGTGRSDAFMAGVYGRTAFGPAYIAGALGFANQWFNLDRTPLGDHLTSSFSGQDYSGRLEAGYHYTIPFNATFFTVTPYGAIQSQYFHTPQFTEADLTGGGLGLTFGSQHATDTRSELGAQFENLQVVNTMPVVLRARAAWAHDWISNPAFGALFQTLPGSNFTVNGAKTPADSALTSASAEWFLTSAWSASAKFEGDFARGSQTYAGTGTLRYRW